MSDAAADFELEDVILAFQNSKARDTHTCIVGQVVKYNSAAQTADIQPMVRVACKNELGQSVTETHPIMPNVPIRWPNFGGFMIIGPLSVGDFVDVHFMESDPSLWRTTGQLSDPLDLRTHSLSFAFATPGARPDTSPLTDPGAALVIGNQGTPVQMVIDGTHITLGSGSGSDFIALAGLVNTALASIRTTLNTHTHVAPPGGGTTATGLPQQAPLGDVSTTIAKAK